MTSVSHSFTALLSPDKMWRALTDFNRWSGYLIIEDAKDKGWGNRWQAQGEPGQGMKLMLYDDQALMQEWTVQDWAPPKRLKLASSSWRASPQLAMDSSLEFTLTPVSPVETRFEIRMDARFSHPILGIFLSVIPIKTELSRALARFERGLVAALSGG
jgi:uncharacterized protein YndB with AHSA1/START domain